MIEMFEVLNLAHEVITTSKPGEISSFHLLRMCFTRQKRIPGSSTQL